MDNEKKNIKEMNKTQVFNVIILDRSGSMECIRRAAIDGFNETLAGIKKAQENYADTQDHFVTLVTFCSCHTDFVFDKTPAAEAKPLTPADYQPCCCTPLYDAMGLTLTSMRRYVKDLEDAIVVVTIITDGLENASKEFSGPAIKTLVDELRKEGWTFTYMGANQDSHAIAFDLNIRNARNFDYSNEGAAESWEKDRRTRMALFSRISEFKLQECDEDCVMPSDERRAFYADLADDVFDDEENKK